MLVNHSFGMIIDCIFIVVWIRDVTKRSFLYAWSSTLRSNVYIETDDFVSGRLSGQAIYDVKQKRSCRPTNEPRVDIVLTWNTRRRNAIQAPPQHQTARHPGSDRPGFSQATRPKPTRRYNIFTVNPLYTRAHARGRSRRHLIKLRGGRRQAKMCRED